jgi:HPt (histidine-containing phosphotransfer) domain-containing protein
MTQNSNDKQSEKIIVPVDAELEDLIPGFLENRRKDIETLQQAAANSDYETIRKTGHTMKGTGGGYGFDAITDIGRSLEQAATEKNIAEIKRLLSEFARYLEQVEVVYE